MSSYDVIVIGAGIIALEASKVESDAWFAFAVTAVDYYPQLVARLQADGAGETGYAATDELVVAISADEDAQQGYHTLDWRTGERGLFGRESIRTILKNRAYLGYVSSGGQEFQGNHPPLISEKLFEQATSLRGDRTLEGGVIKVEPVCPGILRGIVYCAVCGAKMWHQWANYRGRRRRYYRCGGNSRRTCQAPFVPAEEVEGVMLRVLGGFQLTDELRAAEAEEARRVLGMEQTRPAVDAEAIRGQLERLGEAYADGVLSKARYEQRRDALRAQLAAAPVSTPGPDLEGALTTLGSMPALIAAANVEERGDLARAVFSHVWASGRLIDAITPRGVFLPLVALWKLKMGCLMGFRLSI